MNRLEDSVGKYLLIIPKIEEKKPEGKTFLDNRACVGFFLALASKRRPTLAVIVKKKLSGSESHQHVVHIAIDNWDIANACCR